MKNEIKKIKDEALAELKKIKSSEALTNLEIKYLGRKGEFTGILKRLASLSEADKKTIGKLANETKNEIKKKIGEFKKALMGGEKDDFCDVTIPGTKEVRGHLHPLTQVQIELEDIFTSMGFIIESGPDLESDYFNFEALNIPKNHPARDMQDTFYIDKKNASQEYDLVMRTHTSPVQIRAMLKYGAPLKCVVPGRVYRCEATDACHDHSFFQIECLVVDEGISIANLKAIVKEMMSGIYKQEINIRIRPGFFPFVEPGLEVDMSCLICKGKGCPSCKNSGWLEMGGAGMVHPNVLKAGKIDPEKYSGFAFGFGWDRLAMMKYGIDDIRHFQSGDLRFLEQF